MDLEDDLECLRSRRALRLFEFSDFVDRHVKGGTLGELTSFLRLEKTQSLHA